MCFALFVMYRLCRGDVCWVAFEVGYIPLVS